MIYDVLVIGAGPAGLFAAIAAAGKGCRTLLLERMQTPGRKLLISGSGQCNLTHSGSIEEFLNRYGKSNGGDLAASRFLKSAFHRFGNQDLASFCAERGLELEETEAGKLFPVTRRARDVLDLLHAEARKNGVELKTGYRVLSARRDGPFFQVEGESAAAYRGRALIVATGGASYPATGSSGDGWAIAASFGHRVKETAPSLTPVTVGRAAFKPFVSCAGLALRSVRLSVYRAGKKTATGSGDVLFTHRGLSGPGILDLSRAIRTNDELRVPLSEEALTLEEAEKRLLDELDVHGKRGLIRALSSFGLSESLSRSLLASRGLEAEMKAAVLTREGRRLLAASLAEDAGHPFPVAALGGWDEAMATRGGVDLGEVDAKTMQSRLMNGLFFAGEVLDVDGDTGGFNIQAAVSTGFLAGMSAAAAATTRAAGATEENTVAE